MTREDKKIRDHARAIMLARRRAGFIVAHYIHDKEFYVERNNEQIAGPFDNIEEAREARDILEANKRKNISNGQ